MLQDSSGVPLVDAPISVSAQLLDGPGDFAEYRLSGTVPDDATQAIVGLRLNSECDCSGHGNLTIYEWSYQEDVEAANRVHKCRVF